MYPSYFICLLPTIKSPFGINVQGLNDGNVRDPSAHSSLLYDKAKKMIHFRKRPVTFDFRRDAGDSCPGRNVTCVACLSTLTFTLLSILLLCCRCVYTGKTLKLALFHPDTKGYLLHLDENEEDVGKH